MYPIKQSTAVTLPFFVHDTSGNAVTGLADGSFTKRISKNGGAFGAMTVTISEMENGWYSIPLSTAHSDTVGILSVTFTNAGAQQVNLQFRVDANLPDDPVDAGKISGSTTAADNLQRGAEALVLGAATGTPTTTVIATDLTETTNDHYKGRIVTFTSGNIAGQASDITAYNGTSKELTVTALTDAPSAADTFVIS